MLVIFSAVDGADKLLPHIWRHFPAAFVQTPPSGDAIKLRWKENGLRLLPALSRTSSSVRGGRFVLASNNQNAKAIAFGFRGDDVTFTLIDDRGTHVVRARLSHWLEQNTTMKGARLHHEYEPEQMRVVADAHRIDDQTLDMTWQFVEAAFRDVVICRLATTPIRSIAASM